MAGLTQAFENLYLQRALGGPVLGNVAKAFTAGLQIDWFSSSAAASMVVLNATQEKRTCPMKTSGRRHLLTNRRHKWATRDSLGS